jgi:hypothetical protein
MMFPGQLAGYVSGAMWLSLFAARVPAVYYSYDPTADDDVALSAYNNALLVVIFSTVPLLLLAGYWSVSYMLFRSEFTACPGNYNGIHDPTIHQVGSANATQSIYSLCAIASKTLCHRFAIDALPIRDRFVIPAQTLRKCRAIDAQSPLSLCAIALSSLCHRYANVAQSPRSFRTISLKTLFHRCANAMQSSRKRRAIALSSLRNRCAVAAQLLRNRSRSNRNCYQTLHNHRKVATATKCNVFATIFFRLLISLHFIHAFQFI